MQHPHHDDETRFDGDNQDPERPLSPLFHMASSHPRAVLNNLQHSPPRSTLFTRVVLEDSDDETLTRSSDYAHLTSYTQDILQRVNHTGFTDSNRRRLSIDTYDEMYFNTPMSTSPETIGPFPHAQTHSQRSYHLAISQDSPPSSPIQRPRPPPISVPSLENAASIVWYSPEPSPYEAGQFPVVSDNSSPLRQRLFEFPRNSLSQHSRPPPINVPTPGIAADTVWHSPESPPYETEQFPMVSEVPHSPTRQQYSEPPITHRRPLNFTTSNLYMSEAFHVRCIEDYLLESSSSTDNALAIFTSRDVVEGGEALQMTFQDIRDFLHRFSSISISLRNEPESPDPTKLWSLDEVDKTAPKAVMDFQDAVNLQEFTWRGPALYFTQVITGLPKNNLTAFCITDCQISLDDACVIVKSLPNLERLEIDRIEERADNVLYQSPFLTPTFSGISQINHLKITSSAPLQRFLEDIKFLDSNTSLGSVHLIPYGARTDIIPDMTLWEHRLVRRAYSRLESSQRS